MQQKMEKIFLVFSIIASELVVGIISIITTILVVSSQRFNKQS